MTDFVQQLKRRAVVQWTLAYLGSAWLVLQILDVVAEPWGVSDGIARGVQVSLALGLLLTLVLAWYHGERGQQRVSRSELLIVGALLAAAGVLVPNAIAPRAADSEPIVTARPEARTIAVLPFADLSESGDQAYFGEGMSEEILNGLARIPDLRVSARTSAFLLRNEDIATIGDRLGVSTILEGSVRREGDLVRVVVQLVDVATESYLWSGEYDRQGGAVLAVQEEIAREVARALEVELGVTSQGVLTTNTESTAAYDLYFRGRFEWNKRTPEAFGRALGYFEQALESDPEYAAAYSGLADTYILLFEYQQLPLGEAVPAATAAARRALTLEPTLGEARTSMGEILAAQRQWTQAEVEFRQALEAAPSYATGHHWYGYFLSHLGRHEEAIAELTTAKELDPLSAIIRRDLAAALYHARLFDAAIAEADECERLGLQPPRCGQMVSIRLRALEALDRYSAAERLVLEIGARGGILQVDAVVDRARIAARLGRGEEALAIWAEAQERFADHLPAGLTAGAHAFRAEILTAAGDFDAALSELEAAMDLGFAVGPILLREWPAFDPLRGTVRFDAILERMRYP